MTHRIALGNKRPCLRVVVSDDSVLASRFGTLIVKGCRTNRIFDYRARACAHSRDSDVTPIYIRIVSSSSISKESRGIPKCFSYY